MKFIVEIELGNAAMHTAEHVSEALYTLSDKLADGWDFESKTLPGTVWSIMDKNGNRVGKWGVKK